MKDLRVKEANEILDILDDEVEKEHSITKLCNGLVAGFIVIAVGSAVLNQTLEKLKK